MRLGKYLKTAFRNRWNLLLLGGGAAFSLLSGRADVFLPVVAAMEILYLALLGTHPKFQAYVEAQESKGTGTRIQGADVAAQALRTIMRSLPREAMRRFEELRNRCIELRQIARQIKDPGGSGFGMVLEDSQWAGLDRLLWIYLRMLFTHHSLQRFLGTTSGEEIEADIASLEKRLQEASRITDEVQKQRFTRTIEDNLQTCRDRLANYQKASANQQFMQLEINRLENKIQSLSELAVNRQEPDYITGQVDQVTSSMIDTERAMNELQFATGLTDVEDSAPQLLRQEQLEVEG